jgi:hypothetical protein
MEQLTEEEVKASFEPGAELWLPNFDRVEWAHRDFLSWVHPSGHLGYLVTRSPNDGCLHGVVLRRHERKPRAARLDMCSICHHVHAMGGAAMFTLTEKGSGGRRTFSHVICGDLGCSLRIRDLVTPKSFMQENIYLEAKIWRILQHLHKWLTRANYL